MLFFSKKMGKNNETNELIKNAGSFTKHILETTDLSIPKDKGEQLDMLMQWCTQLMGHERIDSLKLSSTFALFKYTTSETPYQTYYIHTLQSMITQSVPKKEIEFIKRLFEAEDPLKEHQLREYNTTNNSSDNNTYKNQEKNKNNNNVTNHYYEEQVAEYFVLLSFLYVGNKEKKRAYALLEHLAMCFEPNTFVYFSLARICDLKHDLTYNRFSIELDPEYSLAYNNYGYTLRDEKRLSESIHWFKEGLALYPNDILYYTNTATHYFEFEKNTEKGIEVVTEAIKKFPNVAKGYYYRAHFHEMSKNYLYALKDAHTASRLEPDNIQNGVMYAILLLRFNRYNDAITVLNKLIETHPENSYLYVERGRLFMIPELINQYWEKAFSNMKQAIKLKEDNAPAHFALGFLHGFRGENEKSIEKYRTAIKYQPEYPHAYHNIAHIYHLVQYEPSKALEAYNKVLEIDPDFHSTIINRRQLLNQISESLCHGNL